MCVALVRPRGSRDIFRPFGPPRDAHRLTTRAPVPDPPPQDFYENLSLSEKIVDGHVKLMLVRSRSRLRVSRPAPPRAARSEARFGNLTSARVPLARPSNPPDPHPHPPLFRRAARGGEQRRRGGRVGQVGGEEPRAARASSSDGRVAGRPRARLGDGDEPRGARREFPFPFPRRVAIPRGRSPRSAREARPDLRRAPRSTRPERRARSRGARAAVLPRRRGVPRDEIPAVPTIEPRRGPVPGTPAIVPGFARPPRSRGRVPGFVFVLGRRRGRRRRGTPGEGDGGRRVGSRGARSPTRGDASFSLSAVERGVASCASPRAVPSRQ